MSNEKKATLMLQKTQNKVRKITDILLNKANDLTNKKYKNLYTEFENQLSNLNKKNNISILST